MNKTVVSLFISFGCITFAWAKLSTPAIFGDNMVLQRDHPCPVWGWSDPNSSIALNFAGKLYQTKSDNKGNWKILIEPQSASSNPKEMVIAKGIPGRISAKQKDSLALLKDQPESLVYKNILIGEVWLCSGQSNMGWTVNGSQESDLEILSANYANLRLLTVPQVGTQEPQVDFQGSWKPTTRESAKNFSAVGYFFGRRLHQILGIPVGLINNSWGGSACEAWIPRDKLKNHPLAQPYMKEWEEKERNYDFDSVYKTYENKLKEWEAENKSGNAKAHRPRPPRNQMTGQHRPANLYNGVLYPVIGFGIRGAIWYQGESNAGRAHAYREIFPLMIQSWRQAWGQGDFPFYWAQLADFKEEIAEPGDSTWAELRESQTLSLQKVKNSGEAVIIDTGEGRDIHPRNKQTVANRLLRHALVNEYGHKIPNQSPLYKTHEIKESKIQITFDHTGGGLYCFDTKTPQGFTICGADKKFVWAQAKLIGKDKVEVWSETVTSPIAVRYAWADNPKCNLYRKDGSVTLPVTPFRTDNFSLTTMDK